MSYSTDENTPKQVLHCRSTHSSPPGQQSVGVVLRIVESSRKIISSKNAYIVVYGPKQGDRDEELSHWRGESWDFLLMDLNANVNHSTF